MNKYLDISPEVQQALADGITLDNAEELARLLENYSS